MSRSISKTAVRLLTVSALAVTGLVAVGHGQAQATTGLTAGDLVVYRVGSGSGSLGSAATAVYLDEYSTSGTLVESIPMPTTGSGSANAFTDSGTAASDGELSLSANGQYLAAAAYNAPVRTASVTSTNAVTVARVDASANVDTSTTLPAFAAGNNVRGAVTSDGQTFWVSGASGGIDTTTLGSIGGTQLNSSDVNFRQLSIQGGQLYASSNKNSLTVAAVGTGLPTDPGTSIANLSGNPDSGNDPYGFVFFNLKGGASWDTLYVADNTAGKIYKFTSSGAVGAKWSSSGSEKVASVTGLTGTLVGSTPTLYATASGSSGTSGTLYKVTDTSGVGGTMSGSSTTLASSASNEAFRGVAFAPGTNVTTTSVTPPPVLLPAQADLPGAIGDSNAATDTLSVADAASGASAVTVTATSSNTAVVPNSGLTISGSGASRTMTVSPTGVGYATITLKATAPNGAYATATVNYAASAATTPANAVYYSGAGNGSAAIDVGGGFMLVGDDESDVLRLYQEGVSGPPVKTFDFTNLLPYGDDEVDIEAAAEVGNRIYWTGSMSNTSSGNLAPERSTLFATDVTGSGASTTLTYVGSYTGLRDDLISWDEDNGSGLGANYLGFADSAASGVGGHEADAFNLEGMEFAPGSSSTAYLAFRAPLEPTGTRNQALIVPVTDINALVTGAASQATFGAPIFFSLNGLGFRDLKKNSANQYVLIAGSADETDDFALYTWDGVAADAAASVTTALPAGGPDGSWESIVSVPNPLSNGGSVSFFQDNGDSEWYGDGLDSKDGLAQDFQKDLGTTLTFQQ